MPQIEAATWSAIAATFAGLSSFLIMLIQRRNLLESVRPEIVLVGWGRRASGEGESAHEVLSFKTVKNVGRGVALHVMMISSKIADNRPVTMLSNMRVPVIAVNETIDLNGEIIVWWKNVKPAPDGHRFLPITITIFCWDSRNMRHETTYSLLMVESSERVAVSDAIAPGVSFGHRTTTTRPVWFLQLKEKLGRLVSRWRRAT
jgi:hypothetical protein